MSAACYGHVLAAFKQAATMPASKQTLEALIHSNEDSFQPESRRQYDLAIKLMRCEGFCAREMIDVDDSVMLCELPARHDGPCEQG